MLYHARQSSSGLVSLMHHLARESHRGILVAADANSLGLQVHNKHLVSLERYIEDLKPSSTNARRIVDPW